MKLKKPAGPVIDLAEYRKISPEQLASLTQPATDTSPRARVIEPHIQLTERVAVAIAKAMNSPAIMVWYQIVYLTWKGRGGPVTLANKKLKSWGVSRDVKTRVLRDFEKAGLIRVERRPRKSPRIIVLVNPWYRGKAG
jgi:hypothetical protein